MTWLLVLDGLHACYDSKRLATDAKISLFRHSVFAIVIRAPACRGGEYEVYNVYVIFCM